jgi:dinuclear metal center YbgI/SA1388 family protein
MVPLPAVVRWLDDYLRIAQVPDSSTALNGLQVECRREVGQIVAAVDASLASIQAAADASDSNATLLLVHHGLFWDGNQAITGRRYERISKLLQHDVAVYSAHIPLDVHEDVGNNAVLGKLLGLKDAGWFDDYKGVPIGVVGTLAVDRGELVTKIDSLLLTSAKLIPGGPARTSRVGIISGAAGDRVRAARDAGCDTFITGEGSHHTFFDAMELGVNLIYAGHYATETVGVKALAERVEQEFGLPWTFFDHPTGM